jgi:two-component system response regulator HydG
MAINTGKILIIDDNQELLAAFRLFLSPHFKVLKTESNPARIAEHLKKDDYDVILLDMNFAAGVNTGNEGIFWLREILKYDPLAIVVLLTAYGDVPLAVKSIKEGATDFIQKSWEEDKILSTILSAYQLRQSRVEIKSLRNKHQHLNEKFVNKFSLVKGISRPMKKVFETIEKVAPTDANILLTGDSGTGKEVIAREIHRLSERAEEIFVTVDLGSLAPSLFESEMFGYVKGAFTDAREERAGYIEVASGGTLFLDEISNLPIELQSKLLSVIQNREFSRLGSVKKIPVDFRLICASNISLPELVQVQKFRQDLLYRINTFQVELPPLSDRKLDIPLLAIHFLNELAIKYKKSGLKISEQAIEKLRNHSWPGNVRELQHVIEKAVILSEDQLINESGIHFSAGTRTQNEDSFDLDAQERQWISRALDHYEWNMTATSKSLGINRSTLYEKIKKYELKPL